MALESKTYCPKPFSHIELYPDGRFRPCCKAIMPPENNMKSVPHKDYWNADSMLKIRKELLNGGRPNECRRCWELEAQGGLSLRQQALARKEIVHWAKESEVAPESGQIHSRPRHLMVTLSNKCNLQCRMCNGIFSSKWEDGYNRSAKAREWFEQLGPIVHNYGIDDYRREGVSQSLVEDVMSFFEKGIHDLRVLSILGGEPFAQDEHYELLKKCAGYEQNITLSYSSNLSVPCERFQNYMDLWEKFAQVSLTVSIDGPPGLNEFIRHGTKQSLVEKNIASLHVWSEKNPSKLMLFAGCTFSAYNIKFIPETVRYVTGLGLKLLGNIAETPFFLRCQVLPPEEKIEITRKVEAFLLNLEAELEESFQANKRWALPHERLSQIGNIKTFATTAIAMMNSADESSAGRHFAGFNEMFEECFVAK